MLDTLFCDDNWHESLIGLERGAGNGKGQRVVLEAADYLLNWPPRSDASTLDCQLTVKRLTSYLSTFVKTMRNVSEDFLDQDVPSWITITYKNRMQALEEKMTAITYLNSLLYNTKSEADSISDGKNNSMINTQYLSVGSIDDLVFCFVQFF